MITITNVSTLHQRDATLLQFALPGPRIVETCRVLRFGDDTEGVNRALNQNHALRISEAMLKPDVLWLEPLCGALMGPWEVRDNVLIGRDGAFICVDDGQHRLHALSVLNPLELERLEFSLMVTQGLTYEQRMRLFRMQMTRRPVDMRLDLAQRHHLGDWKHSADGEAYEILLALNTRDDSPLKGIIRLGQDAVHYSSVHRPDGIPATGLYNTVRAVIGRKSPLVSLTPEKRSQVVMTMVDLIPTVWPSAWASDSCMLKSARGINGVLMLVVRSTNFRGIVGNDFSKPSLERGLTAAKSYDWKRVKHVHVSVETISDRLNQSIQRNSRVAA